ncbi:MAG: DUF2461 domain-containing protein [Deltaproteobacteria bacterium]|jgi:uncharacterized protein (TIGR02453 family)|nr:DUF2461 domain-containing protein [Deltaproteobacteria bacterium]
MKKSRYFGDETFAFLKELAENNNRQWFQENKERYEAHVKEAAIRFIVDFEPHLKKISRHFVADPRPVGGSLFRIYRDVRFSKDKRPYKTNTGVQFRHSHGKDVHAPGFYLHLEPNNLFAAAGIWHPDSATLGKIRDAIIEHPSRWKKAIHNKAFRSRFTLTGDTLRRAPRGYDPDHPLIEDLKRKDFIGVTALTQKAAGDPAFPKHFKEICSDGSSLVTFLTSAVGLPF